MRHARDDYNRIQDPAGLIPDDEPVFLLRGQDVFAPMILRRYAFELEAVGGDKRLIQWSRDHADRMVAWQHNVKAKNPDALP